MSLNPAIALTRSAVRDVLRMHPGGGAIIVALSGGADSLALLAATQFEAPKLGFDVHAVVIDHQLQADSAQVAASAAEQARALGASSRVVPVLVAAGEGLEADARAARYKALTEAAIDLDAALVLTGHTLDDQAETVLLQLSRGSGSASLQGMAPVRELAPGVSLVRPFLSLRRADTDAACRAASLSPWYDPHNTDPRFKRVLVRHEILPMLERSLGPGIAQALARTAEIAREDADAFQEMIDEVIEDIVEPAEAGIAISAAALLANPAALRNRIIRFVVWSEFGVSLSRQQTLAVAELVTAWRGQGPIDLPGLRAERSGQLVTLRAASS